MSRVKIVVPVLMICIAAVVFAVCIKFSVLTKTTNKAHEQDSSGWDTYSDTWVATDELGRTLPNYEQTGPVRDRKFVGICYLLWHHNVFYGLGDELRSVKPPDITQILTKNPGALNSQNVPPWGVFDQETPYYWGRPLFGYYDLDYDSYVLQKHAQMLSDAGIDFLMLDFTNLSSEGNNPTIFYNWNGLMNLCKVFTDIRNKGGKTPQITFLLRWDGPESAYATRRLYDEFYSKNLYPDLWFKWEGKPLLLGDKRALDVVGDKDIIKFFTFRKGHPEYTSADMANEWSWNQLVGQQPSYTDTNPKEQIAVGSSQNWTSGLAFFSSMDSKGNFIARGRSYHDGNEPLSKDPLSPEYPSKYGYNFQEGLDGALEIDPSVLTVASWNEWCMGRFQPDRIPNWAVQDPQPEAGAFCDDFTPEFSRDIEPTPDGGLDDNFYYQLASAVRKFKGVRKPFDVSGSKTISIDGDFSDWKNVKPDFRDDIGDKAVRNAKSLEKDVTYKNNTGRNDFKLMKVARDKRNIYFYAETMDDISSYTDSNWMRLFIKTNDAGLSWEGYNFVVNRIGITDTTTTLEKSTGGWNWSAVNKNIKYKVSGNKLELAIPRSDLGLDNTDKPLDIQFKWNDNMQNQGDIYEFYLNGDTAPNNRFNYHFTEKNLEAVYTRNLYSSVGLKEDTTISSGDAAAAKFDAETGFDGLEVFLTKPSWQRVDDNNNQIKYTGIWGSTTGSGYYNNSLHFTGNANSYVEYTFTGTGVKCIGDKGPDRGKIDIYIDDRYMEKIDTYSPQPGNQQVLYESKTLSNQQHKIKIVVTGSKSSNSIGIYQSIDAFEYLPGNTGSARSLDMKLFKWKKNYKTTISGAPLASHQFENPDTDTWLKLDLPSQKPGKYLWVIEKPDEPVCIARYAKSTNPSAAYLNGKETAGNYKARINYND